MNKIKNTIGFRITRGKGFHITFENGYTVSVQFGPGSYCDNYDAPFMPYETSHLIAEKGSATAECAVWGPDGGMIRYGNWDDTVSNRSTPAEVLTLLSWAATQPVVAS